MNETIIVSGISIADFKSMIADLVEKAVEKKAGSISLQPNQQKQYLTRKETSELLGGVSMPTLNALDKSGVLTPFRLGTKVMYRLSDIQAMIDGQIKTAA